MERYLTHREIESLCDLFMENKGWDRVKKASIFNENKLESYAADRIYTKNGVVLAFEIKPENALDEEIKRGIGQLACFLPYQIRPYLVFSEAQWSTMERVIKFLPWLGAAVYKSMFELEIKQKSTRDYPPVGAWGWPDILLPVGDLPIKLRELTYDHIYSFIKKRELKGFHSVKELEGLLKEAYPNYKVFKQNIGSALKGAGFKQKYKDGSIHYEL